MGRSRSRVTIADVADLADVSRSSVSNFLNAPERLSPAKRHRIEQAISALNYVPSDAARQLRVAESSTIAYVAFEVGNIFFVESADVIEEEVSRARLHLLVANTAGKDTREQEYLHLFEQQRVRGVIIAPIGEVEPTLARMRDNGIPSVITGRKGRDNQPSVSVDDFLGGEIAAGHLLDIGRRRIAFVGGPLAIEQVDARFRGAVKAVSQVPGATIEIIATTSRAVVDGLEVGRALAARPREARPDAVFAVNDLLALGVMRALEEDGTIAVPDDIAIIGYDKSQLAGGFDWPISTISHPHAEATRLAVELLLGEINGNPATDRQIVFEPTLVVRESTVRASG